MNEDEINMLNDLEKVYISANSVCDPIEFAQRQQRLMYGLADFLLQPLQERRKEQNKR